MVPKEVLAHLDTQFRRGKAVLFTGAGFSRAARNIRGDRVPTAPELRELLWHLCFPDEPVDESSSLQDLFQYALSRNRERLTELLRQTLTADTAAIPPEYVLWFSMPWHRVYTLNIDDLASAVSRRYSLPRALRVISATSLSEPAPRYGEGLEVVHLNGTLEDIPDGVTFSTLQYAERLARQEPWYVRCVADILTHPVVFVGTRLDEPSLWQHMELRRTRGGRDLRELRPKSYLVSPHLDRPRGELLRQFNIVHLPLTMEQFTADVLSALTEAAEEGRRTLELLSGERVGRRQYRNIPDVAELARRDPLASTEYLLGQEPTWADLQSGRAVWREVDGEIRKLAEDALGRSGAKGVVLVTGTAGSGKSTALMRLALAYSAEGRQVGWVDKYSDLSPAEIRHGMDQENRPDFLFIDDVDIYGAQAAALVREIAMGPGNPLVVVGGRSTRADRTAYALRQMGVPLAETSMPHLTDSDIAGLIGALDHENRLGVLKGKPRVEQERAFREQAGRQLLVAMLQATSGRRFEDRIVDEMAGLDPDSLDLYCLIATATTLRHFLSKDEVLLAARDASNATLNTLETLLRRQLVVPAAGGAGVTVRHRVIAEVVFERMAQNGSARLALVRIAFMAASKVAPTLRRGSRSWRLLKSLINHDFLLRVIGLDGGRDVYDSIQELLTWDYHYWLQRGSLELEAGDLRLAENFLNQAYSLAPDDPLVETEYAYLQIRLGVESPIAPGAHERVVGGFDILENAIERRGASDPYPYHVLGSQGLAWSRRAMLPARERRDLLQRLVGLVDEGRKNHPWDEDLEKLYGDLHREWLKTAVDAKYTHSEEGHA